MPQARRAVSDLTLEQYHLGELSAKQQRAMREELAHDEVLRGRLAAIQNSDVEIRSSYPAERLVPLIRERMLREGAGAERRARRLPTLAWAVPVAVVALILLSLPLVLRAPDVTRLKGVAPHLLAFRKTEAGAVELRSGAVARRGDVLQLSYAAGDAKYGVIFSIDGRGRITWHVPAGYAGGARTAPPLDPKGPVVLPSAYELDDAPYFERFFLVYSPAPFDVSAVDRVGRGLASRIAGGGSGAAGESGALALPRGLGQFSLLLKKQG
jgi:anti-sigma factor RsiW